jgi:HicB family
MRQFSGRVLLRMPTDLHRELAEEAFRTGKSINQLCLEALFGRRVLKQYDPWRAVERVWQTNKGVSGAEVEKDVAAAVREVRRARRRRQH